MKLIITNSYDELSQKAGQIVKQAILKKADLVLGLATGSTPIGLYKELVKARNKEGLDFSKVIFFNLDEYFGIASENKNSYHYFMQKHLFSKININQKSIFILNGQTKNEAKHCQWYEGKIKEKKGIDLQILGIGANGHIGFNEPRSSFNSRTRLVNLNKQTIKDNSRFFSSMDDVPKKALTMGLATIMEAKTIILLAFGKHKAKIIKKALTGPITEKVPASVLQNHSDLIVILDKKLSPIVIHR